MRPKVMKTERSSKIGSKNSKTWCSYPKREDCENQYAVNEVKDALRGSV